MTKDTKPAKGSVVKKILLWGIAISFLVSGFVVATFYVAGTLRHLNPGLTQGGAGEGAALKPEEKNSPPQYVSIDPPFIVNLNDKGLLRYLQVGVSVMTREKKYADAVVENMPRIRNSLIFLFGQQDIESLNSANGKEDLRAKALEAVQAILLEELGVAGVEEVFFTNFVMQ